MRSVKNVIVVNDYSNINGGAAKVAIQSAIGLSERGYNVVFFSAVGPVDKKLSSQVKVICLEQSDLIGSKSKIQGGLQGIWNTKALKTFSKLLSEYNTDDTIIHIHGWTKALSSSVFKAAENQNFKIYVTLHDYFSTCPNGGYYNYKENSICNLKPLSLKCICCNCDRRNYVNKMYRVIRQLIQNRYVKSNKDITYIYISEKNKTVAEKWIESNKNFVKLFNPIDLYNISDNVVNNSDKEFFLYIGRIVPEKGVDIFCKAMSILNLRGVVIGDGEKREQLQVEYPNVDFVGWKTHDEISAYLMKTRALVFPSRWYEGAPLTIIETLSFGVPCIVSDCTSASEIISDGKNGYVFKSDDVDDLCEKLCMMTDEKVAEMKFNIISDSDVIKKQYDINTHIDNLLKIYSE